MSEKAENQKKPSVLSRICNFIFYTLITFVILIAFLYTVITLAGENGVSTIMGYTIGSVQSGSMSGTFEKGDIIIGKQISGEEAKVGEVISFFYNDTTQGKKLLVTHRVKYLRDDGKIVTQGDVVRAANSDDQVEVISKGDVVARYTGVRIPKLGALLDYIKTPNGFFVCILIPVFLFLFWQIYVFIVTVADARKIDRDKKINDQALALAEQMLREREAAAVSLPQPDQPTSSTDEVATEEASLNDPSQWEYVQETLDDLK